DNFLLSVLKGVPKTLVYRIIRKGEVRVNKGRVKADSRLCDGDVVRVPPLRLPEKDEEPPVSAALSNRLDDAIIYEDAGLIAVNMPPGLAVPCGRGLSLGLIDALRPTCPRHSLLDLLLRPDRDPSGLILATNTRAVLTALQKMLANKAGISKLYLSVLHGAW